MTTQNANLDWMIDNRVNLSRAARDAEWHLGTTEETLRAAGLSADDARAFTAFAFSDNAEVRDPDTRPEDYLTDEQWERLSLPAQERQ